MHSLSSYILYFVLSVAVLGFNVLAQRLSEQRQQRERDLQASRAKELGLTRVSGSWQFVEISGVEVRFGQADWPETVEVLRDNLRLTLQSHPEGAKDRFESCFALMGGPLEPLVALTGEDRAALLSLARLPGVAAVSVQDGHLRVRLEPGPDAARLRGCASEVQRVLGVLERSEQQRGRRLLGLMDTDADPALKVLAAVEILAGEDPRARAEAAERAGRSGVPALGLLCAIDAHDWDRVLVEVGDGALGDTPLLPRLLDLLLAKSPGETLRKVALQLTRSSDGRCQLWAMDALARAAAPRDAEAERSLLALAARSIGEDVRWALVDLLGQVGTAASVPFLRSLEGGGDLGARAEQARSTIQARLEGAELGGLRLAESNPAVGAIRAVEEEPGALRAVKSRTDQSGAS